MINNKHCNKFYDWIIFFFVMTLVFDFDSTLCVDESLVTVLEYSLKSNDIKWKEKVKQIEQITQLGVTGKISMPESYKQRLAIAKPTIASITKYLHDAKQNDKITPGMRQLIADFRKQFPNVGIHVLSQGPKCVIDPIAQTVGIPSENCHAVILDVENGEKTGKYIADDEPMLHLGKSKILKKLLAEKKIKEPIIMV